LLCFFVTCVLMVLFALYFLWMGSHPFLLFIHGFSFAFIWCEIYCILDLHVCVDPSSFLVSFTFSALLSYISLNPKTQLQNWLKEIWDLITKYHNNKEGSRLRYCIWEWGNINMTCSFWWISSPLNCLKFFSFSKMCGAQKKKKNT
jgi:predicted PurR-regulated permease PerM